MGSHLSPGLTYNHFVSPHLCCWCSRYRCALARAYVCVRAGVRACWVCLRCCWRRCFHLCSCPFRAWVCSRFCLLMHFCVCGVRVGLCARIARPSVARQSQMGSFVRSLSRDHAFSTSVPPLLYMEIRRIRCQSSLSAFLRSRS